VIDVYEDLYFGPQLRLEQPPMRDHFIEVDDYLA